MSIAYKIKLLKGKRSSNKRMLRSNNWLSKRPQFVKCLIRKGIDTRKKSKLFNKDWSKMNLTSMKNTQDWSKKSSKKKNILTTKISCFEMKLPISKVKEVLLRNLSNNKKRNSKVRGLYGERKNKTIKKLWLNINLKMRNLKKEV